MASWAAAISFFSLLFWGGKKILKFLTHEKKNGKMKKKKKRSHSTVICSPGRWTGKNFSSRLDYGGLGLFCGTAADS